jgi:perosamine synthetase
MHKQPIFNRMGLFLKDDLPNSERLYERGFYIPSGLALTNDEMLEVSNVLHKVLL